MPLLAEILTAVVAILHTFFLVLEMFLWETPFGRRTFHLTEAQAKETAKLAKNQGLYNGFLVAGLLWSFRTFDPGIAHSLRLFFLGCVTVAGVYGGFTVKRSIFWIQAVPGAAALAATWASW